MPSTRHGSKASLVILSLIAVGGLVLAGCSAGGPGGSSSSGGKAEHGGTATFALENGDDFSWMLPLPNQANYEPWDQDVEYDSWRPLYFAGDGTKPVIDQSLSIAYPPKWSDNDTTVTIRLKKMRWSDGLPVTTRDVRFFFDLYDANKANIATYIPGDIPDNVASVTYPSSSEFVIHLKHSFSEQWYDGNELTDIVPLPQQAWDRESVTGKIGNYDLTPAGAVKVFDFLTAQSKELQTYSTNPLWKVVDGPWVVSSYNPTTARLVESANLHYTGAAKPHLAQYVLEAFPSDTAEVDALRSGSITYGYLPFSDLGLSGYLKSQGYTIAPWAPEYVNWAELGYTSPTYGPLVRQLYIRQALQHLVDEPLDLKATLHGDGQLTYGPVPNIPHSPYVSPQEKKDPYPYSKRAAANLLEAHGWKLGSNHVFVCENPGTDSSQCGSGIARGRQFNLLLMYATGHPSLTQQVEAFVTDADAAGLGITLDPQTESTMFSIAGVCPPGPCNWGIAWYESWLWNFGQADVYPTGGQMFGKGNYWGGGYYSPTTEQLIDETHTQTGLKYLYSYENYVARQVAALWVPTSDNQISVVSDKLHGWQPQQVFGDPLPEMWYYSK